LDLAPPFLYMRRMALPPESEEIRFPDEGGCFGCSKLNPHGLGLRFWRVGDSIQSRYVIPDRFHGAPGVAHGGIVAAILDEVSCAAIAFLRDSYVVTGELTVRYVRPCHVEQELTVSARIAGEHRRYLIVEAEVRRDGELLARSTGKFFPVEAPFSSP
jgi:acyl-coenzyme A thioesterase PaaI-like protein